MSKYVDELESVFSELEATGSFLEETMQIAILFWSSGSTGDSVCGPTISPLQTMADDYSS